MQLLHNYPTLSESSVSYFRHKGLKVKFSDIENAIADYPYLNGATVVCNEDKQGNRCLVAYIIPSGTFNQTDITSFLFGKLKPFMIPEVWVCVHEFPLTAWGTIDKNALSERKPDVAESDVFIAPSTKTEIRLARIVQDLLQIETISVTDDFFRLGGNSLKALRLVAAIRKELNVSIDIKCFFLYPTIAKLAGYLNSSEVIRNSAYTALSKQTDTQPSVLHNSSIVPIKPTGKKIPLYIICGGGGSVFTFEKFAHLLGYDQPVYGFQQPSDINELDSFPDTIEGIATKYVHELLTSNPNGPYALSGHCIGGVIALEMARQLQVMGKKIHLLALFDVILTEDQEGRKIPAGKRPSFITHIKQAGKSILQKIEFETYLLARYPKDALDYKWEKVKAFVNTIYPFQKENLDEVVFSKFEQKFENAYTNYKVKHFSGSLLVFNARDNYRFIDKDRNIRFKKKVLSEEIRNKWKAYASNVKIFEVDGDHASIFEPVYASNFTNLLRQHL